MRTRANLHGYQEDAVDFILTHDGAMVYATVGAGKTAIALTALVEGGDLPALIVAPKRVCELVWDEEATLWEHTKHLTFSKILGTPAQRVKAIATKADIYLINYENLIWLMGVESPDLYTFKAIVWDEISRMKSAGAWWKAAQAWARSIPVRIGTTASPVGNNLVGVWAQAHLIDTTNALGRNITAFRTKWCYQPDHEGHSWSIFPGGWAEDEITTLMSAYTFRMNPADYAQLPRLNINDIMIPLSDAASKLYRKLTRDLLVELSEDDTIEAANAAVLTGKQRQMAGGEMYNEDGVAIKVHEGKWDALSDLITQLSGEPLLLFYDFKYQYERIMRDYPQAVKLTPDTVRQWNKGEVPILVAHPASAGHGLNLAQGGANVCFMSIPWSLELYEQSIGRLYRQGQTKPVFVHRLLTAGTIDNDVSESLSIDGIQQNHILRLLQDKQAVILAEMAERKAARD